MTENDFGDEGKGGGEFVPANRWQKKEPFNAVAHDKKLGWANAPQNERIAWHGAVNDSVQSLGIVDHVYTEAEKKIIRENAKIINKIILEGPND